MTVRHVPGGSIRMNVVSTPVAAALTLLAALLADPRTVAGTEPAAQPAPKPATMMDAVKSARRIVFLGDSITHDGRWVADLAAWMESKGLTAELIDVGLSSETVSGLSEDGHANGKFPRPDVAERIDRVLRITRPDLVFACYGMNCGIYRPLDEGRFARFKEGMERLHAKVEAAGATIIHLTPPVYDQRPDKPGPAGPFFPAGSPTGYDAVLAEYSRWLLSKRSDGWLVIDVHGPMRKMLDERRAADATFVFAPDAVHPDDAGHWAICRAVLAGLGDSTAAAAETNAAVQPFLPEATARLRLLRDAYLAAAGHQRPGMPAGLPLGEAEARARRITDSIRSRRLQLLGRKHPRGEWQMPIEWPRPPVVDPGPAPGRTRPGAAGRDRAVRRQEPGSLEQRGAVEGGRRRRHHRCRQHPDEAGIRRLPGSRGVSPAGSTHRQGAAPRQLRCLPDGTVRDPGARLVRGRHRRAAHLSRRPVRGPLQAAAAGRERLPSAR